MRIYDPRVGRFLSVDPLEKKYPWYSSYQYASDKPILNRDIDGLQAETEDVEAKEAEREEINKNLDLLRTSSALKDGVALEEEYRIRELENETSSRNPKNRFNNLKKSMSAYGQNALEAAEGIFGGIDTRNSLNTEEAVRKLGQENFRLQINRSNARTFEDVVETQLKETNSEDVASQVTLVVTGRLNGQNAIVRIRIDNIKKENGKFNLYEAKYSVEQVTTNNYSRTLTPNQQQAFAIIANGTDVNIVVRGNNANQLGFKSGDDITAKIGDVKIVTNTSASPSSAPQVVKAIKLPANNTQGEQR